MTNIRKSLEALGFERIDSGGGCTAMWKEVGRVSFILSDAANSVDFDDGSPIGISAYVDTDDYVACADIRREHLIADVSDFVTKQVEKYK